MRFRSLFQSREARTSLSTMQGGDAETVSFEPDLSALYDRFADFTMINRTKYVETLGLLRDWQLKSQLKGDVVECGCWRGGMTAGMAEVLGAVGTYHLFDSFEGLPPVQEIDGVRARQWQENVGGPKYHDNCRAEQSAAEKAMGATQVAWQLHPGWFEQTFPVAVVDDLCVLRLDGDWYDSTMLSLETFYPRLREGGLLLIDDYYIWEGCARAVHDYLSRIQSTSRIRSKNQVCYIEKTETLA